MAVEDDDDRLGFLEDWEKATLADGTVISAIFDNEYDEALEVTGTVPRLTGRTSDLSDVVVGSTITIDLVDYTVRVLQPDGAGMTTLVLELV